MQHRLIDRCRCRLEHRACARTSLFSFYRRADILRDMRLSRQGLLFLAMMVVLIFSAVMAVRQYVENHARHSELREALIFLHDRGYNDEAQRVYTRLLMKMEHEPTRHLVDDLHRTSMVTPTNQSASTNILVRYHLSVKKELEKRFEDEFLKARNQTGS
jgi:hypothetical protein